jgi:hypothetical protein
VVFASLSFRTSNITSVSSKYLFWFCSLISARTTMQIVGMYRNCICCAGADNWRNIININHAVNVVSGMQDARNSSRGMDGQYCVTTSRWSLEYISFGTSSRARISDGVIGDEIELSLLPPRDIATAAT